MAGNSFGQLFKISTFGESHGGSVGVVIDGCPPGLSLTEDDIQPELDRRKPGQSDITTPRKEADQIQILSGVFEGQTTGTPILILAFNKDMRPQDYNKLGALYRPSHADYTYQAKYGFRDHRGSGRASARETLARVAAGAVAKKFLKEKLNIEFLSYVEQVGDIRAQIDYKDVTLKDIESNIVRCPDKEIAKKMISLIEEVRDDGDSIGGVVKGVIRNVPVGLGEPVFDKIPADLGKAMMSINAVKGFEIGSGFDGVKLRGSQHNDPFKLVDGKVKTTSNNAGGTLEQDTVNLDNEEVKLKATGRHDPCVLPRAVPIVDGMAALVIMDHYLRNKAQNS
ncbi:UNVERIFIED_CONTAM: hypothetical protein GTU68_006112 [Idotea baltica]|nr:hypothetical protein [Idotea baltica]